MSHSTKLPSGFSTRQLKTEGVLLRRRLIVSEGHVKELMRVNDGMCRRGKRNKGGIGALEGEKEAEEKAKKLSEEPKAHKAKPIETETRIRQLIFEKGQPSKMNHDLEGRVNALEGGSKEMKMSHRTPTTISRDFSKVTSVLCSSQFSFCPSFPLPLTTFTLGG